MLVGQVRVVMDGRPDRLARPGVGDAAVDPDPAVSAISYRTGSKPGPAGTFR